MEATTKTLIKAKQSQHSSALVANVVDDLTSASTTDALSANQGRILNEKIESLEDVTITSLEADKVTYDNADSGLSSTDVQGAIDELKIATDESGNVSYDEMGDGDIPPISIKQGGTGCKTVAEVKELFEIGKGKVDYDVISSEGGEGEAPLNDMLRSLGVVDYVVEQGIDGRWFFRKWNSGIAEAWCTVGSRSYAMTNPFGYAYYAYGSMQLPSGLFKGGVHATSDRCGGNSGNGLVQTAIHTANSSSIDFYIWDTSSETVDTDVALNVKGWWK